jgi:DUF1680 family protein
MIKSTITGSFWSGIIGNVRHKVLLYQWEALNDRIGGEPSGCLRNFRIAAGAERGKFTGMIFQDSDVYKWLEAVAYALKTEPDEKLRALADEAVDIICAAQQPDGYLNTYFIINGLHKRFKNLREAHELYCAGHLIEAAVAYYAATGSEKLLNCARRFADLICLTFGDKPGQIPGYPGHEEVELALVKLYNCTNAQKYAEMAAYFINQRGMNDIFITEMNDPEYFGVWGGIAPYLDRTYYQCQSAVKDFTIATGHAVRAMYLYTAMADVAGVFGDSELQAACERLYRNVTEKQMYITGAIGSTMRGERFTADYDLPPGTAYGETCAGIGLMMFCERMYRLTGESTYIDTLENTLYNNVLAGMSLDGTAFFYVNAPTVHPSASTVNPDYEAVKHVRQPWFGCACCPPNLARTVLSVADYAVDFGDNYAAIKMYLGGEFVHNDKSITINTDYPYGNTVKIRAQGAFTLKLRSPAFAPIKAITVGEKAIDFAFDKGFACIEKDFCGEEIVVELDIHPEIIYTNPNVFYNRGKIAVRRGALIYCAEAIDNPPSTDFYRISASQTVFSEIPAPSGLPENTVALQINAEKLCYTETERLYFTAPPTAETAPLTLIPYFLWGNRGEGDMTVFLGVDF